MLILVLIGLAVWAALATIACLSVCMASARFHRESEQNPGGSDPSLASAPAAAGSRRLAAQQSHP
jgi:hypothetical protein